MNLPYLPVQRPYQNKQMRPFSLKAGQNNKRWFLLPFHKLPLARHQKEQEGKRIGLCYWEAEQLIELMKIPNG